VTERGAQAWHGATDAGAEAGAPGSDAPALGTPTPPPSPVLKVAETGPRYDLGAPTPPLDLHGAACPLAPEPKRRLLEAAAAVFGERGFADATVREICSGAGANVAAVNYHYGDKRALYREALLHAYRAIDERVPLHGGAAEGAPAEERLRAYIRAFVERMLMPGIPSWYVRLVMRELVEPTEAFADAVREGIRPNYLRLFGIVREILGPEADEEVVHRATRSIVAQCTFYRHCAPVIAVITGRPVETLEPGPLAEHIFRFSLAGLGALKDSGGRARS
jgi:AcrR family transcriptional regulator